MILYKPEAKNMRAAVSELFTRVPGFQTVESSTHHDPTNVQKHVDDFVYCLLGALQSASLIDFESDIAIIENPKSLAINLRDPGYDTKVEQIVYVTAGAVWFSEIGELGLENYMSQICSVDSDKIVKCILACRENKEHFHYHDIISAILDGRSPNDIDPLSVMSLSKLFVAKGKTLTKPVRNSFRSFIKRIPEQISGLKAAGLTLVEHPSLGECISITFEFATHTTSLFIPNVAHWGKYRGAVCIEYSLSFGLGESCTFYINNGGTSNEQLDEVIRIALNETPNEIINKWKMLNTMN